MNAHATNNPPPVLFRSDSQTGGGADTVFFNFNRLSGMRGADTINHLVYTYDSAFIDS